MSTCSGRTRAAWARAACSRPASTRPACAPASARGRGFSLIELIIFIMVVTIAIGGVLRIITFTTSNSADPQLRKQALVIAASLLEEIELARFTFCDPSDPNPNQPTPGQCSVPELMGPEPANTSRMYDNVNDYGSLSGAVTYTTDAAGNAFPAGYVAKVTITAETALGPTGSIIVSSTSPNTMNALRISVAVSYNGGDAVVLDGVRTRYAPTWQP